MQLGLGLPGAAARCAAAAAAGAPRRVLCAPGSRGYVARPGQPQDLVRGARAHARARAPPPPRPPLRPVCPSAWGPDAGWIGARVSVSRGLRHPRCATRPPRYSAGAPFPPHDTRAPTPPPPHPAPAVPPNPQTEYSKGAAASIPPPKTIFRAESERMGQFDFSTPNTGERRVPASPAEYAAARTAYQRAMSVIRKGFTAQWDARRKREAAAVTAYQEGVRQAQAENDALREARRVARAVENDARVVTAREARRLRKAAVTRANARATSQLDQRRAAWLAALEADAANWITEERIDEMITEETFAMKVGWQYARWFEAKEAKRSLMEAARRARKPGVPLREVELSDVEYATDWESDLEEPDEVAAAVLADRNAAAEPTGRVAKALEAARRASRSQGQEFPEPNYDDDGRPLQSRDTLAERLKVRGRVGGWAGEGRGGRGGGSLPGDPGPRVGGVCK